MATVLSAHMPVQVTIYPDTQRAVYNPGDTISITLNAMNVDYINFADSILWVKYVVTTPTFTSLGTDDVHGAVQNYFNNFYTRYMFPALGGASLISRFRIYSGTTEMQDYERYWALWGTLAEMAAPRGFSDHATLFNKTRISSSVQSSTLVKANNNIITSVPIWIQIPLISVFNDAGFIPNYQTANKIKLVFTLSQNNAIFQSAFFSMLPTTTIEPNADGDATHKQMVFDKGVMEFFPGIQYGGKVVTQGAYTWSITDAFFRASGLTVLEGGQLDADPVEIFTHSYRVMTAPTTGQMDERIPFQIKRSSVRKVHAIFTAPNLNNTQDPNYPTQGHWLRAGIVGSRNYYSTHPSDQNPVNGIAKAYDPSITWFAIEMGSKRYPTSFGTGENRHPAYRDANTHEMFRAYSRFNGLNDISGRTVPMNLTPFEELNHGWLNKMSHGPGVEEQVAARAWANINMDALPYTQFRAGETIGNPVIFHPAWAGMTCSLYGGSATRAVYRPFLSTTAITKAITANSYAGVSVVSTDQLTGGKFIMATTFASMDKRGKLIQGVDTERYDINLLWSRAEPIAAGMVFPGANTHYNDTNDLSWRPLYQVVEEVPDITVMIDFDVKITIQNGTITLDS